MIDTTELHEFLLKKLNELEGISPPGYFHDSGPPEGKTIAIVMGAWLWVKARLYYEGSTIDRKSGVGGNMYDVHPWYDWVGRADSAPTKASSPFDLDEWAIIKTYYLCEYTDVGSWGFHEGRYVKNIQKDGTVEIRKANGRFHDVTPESMTEVEEIKLDAD